MIKLILFIEKDYYKLSKTMMSSIVHDADSIGSPWDPEEKNEKFDRFDYGFVKVCLENGMEISFRLATKSEIEAYDKKLSELLHNLLEDPTCHAKGSFPCIEVAYENDAGILIKKLLNQ